MDNRDIIEHIADARLTLACAEAVRAAIVNSDHLELSIAEERAVTARGVRYLLNSGAFLQGGKLWLPCQATN